MQGIYGLTLSLMFILLLVGVFSMSFGVVEANSAIISYRRALERKYLEHDIALSYRRMMEFASGRYVPGMSYDEYASIILSEYLRWTSEWGRYGFSVHADPPTLLYLDSGPVLYADTDIRWSSEDYGGVVHVFEVIPVWTGG